MGNQGDHLNSSKGYTSNPSRYIADNFWWKDDGIRLRVWQYIQHRRSYRFGHGCSDGIRSIARALGYSTGYIGKIVAELEGKLEENAPVHLDSEIYGQGRRRSVRWPIGVTKPASIRAEVVDRPIQERTASTRPIGVETPDTIRAEGVHRPIQEWTPATDGGAPSDAGTDAPSDAGVDGPSDAVSDTSKKYPQEDVSEEERDSRPVGAGAAPEAEAQRGGNGEPIRDPEKLAELKAELKRNLDRLAEEKSLDSETPSATPAIDAAVAYLNRNRARTPAGVN